MLPERTLSDLGATVGDRFGRTGGVVGALRPMYATWLKAAYGRRGLPWRVNGEPLRIDPTVRHLVPRESERGLFDYLRAHIRRGDSIFDIGAFVGVYALLESRWAGETGRVVAFEPSVPTFALLQHHLQLNGAEGARVDARCAAIGARTEARALVTFDDEPYRNMIAPAERPAFAPADATAPVSAVDTVDVVTIDEVCAGLGRIPDWIRMDVQGLEIDALRGAAATLREAKGRLRVVAEMHPQHWPDYGIDPREAADRFADLGLQARNIVPGADPFLPDAHAILEPLT